MRTPLHACAAVLGVLALVIAGCASPPSRYKLPPPRNTQPLPTAQGSVHGVASGVGEIETPSGRCITLAGHCMLPAPAPTGLPCTCDSKNPEFSYGGRTGAIPPMPDWADPRLRHAN